MRASLATVSVAGHRETMVMKQARRHQISQRTLSNQLHASRHTIIAILPATARRQSGDPGTRRIYTSGLAAAVAAHAAVKCNRNSLIVRV